MAADEKKNSPALKREAVAKKDTAAKKDADQTKDKSTSDANLSNAEGGESCYQLSLWV